MFLVCSRDLSALRHAAHLAVGRPDATVGHLKSPTFLLGALFPGPKNGQPVERAAYFFTTLPPTCTHLFLTALRSQTPGGGFTVSTTDKTTLDAAIDQTFIHSSSACDLFPRSHSFGGCATRKQSLARKLRIPEELAR